MSEKFIKEIKAEDIKIINLDKEERHDFIGIIRYKGMNAIDRLNAIGDLGLDDSSDIKVSEVKKIAKILEFVSPRIVEVSVKNKDIEYKNFNDLLYDDTAISFCISMAVKMFGGDLGKNLGQS